MEVNLPTSPSTNVVVSFVEEVLRGLAYKAVLAARHGDVGLVFVDVFSAITKNAWRAQLRVSGD